MYCSETTSSLGAKIWDILPMELKKIVSPTLFENKIGEWAPKNCPCRLCKTYVQNIGFMLSYLYVHILFCKLEYFIHIKESVEAVIGSKPYSP